jgi:hypothetical protein
MDEATQDVASSHAPDAGNRCGTIRRRVRRLKVDPAVRPLGVVVGDVFAERPLEMTPTEDERPVKAFTSDGADPSFGEGVRSRSADRGEDGFDAVRGEDRVEAPRVLGVSVPDQVAKASPPFKVPREVAGGLRDPPGVGVRGHAGQMDAAASRAR